MDSESVVLVAVAFALGGVIKGATGAGAPLLAVPLLASLVDVRFAVAAFVLPNIVSNLWQIRRFRAVDMPRSFVLRFALAGGLGAGIGTVLLASFSNEILNALVALILIFYILFRLARPRWQLPFALASKLSAPVGAVAGLMQGATGLSAPVSITFLNATGLERPQFILTISTFFLAQGVVQLPLQWAFGIMNWEMLGLSAMALLPLLAAMPVGMKLGQHMSKRMFDTLLLCLLGLLAVRLLFGIFFGQ